MQNTDREIKTIVSTCSLYPFKYFIAPMSFFWWKVITCSKLLETGTKIFWLFQNMHWRQWKITFCSTCLSEVRGFCWMRMKMCNAGLLTVNYWISCKGKATNAIVTHLHTEHLKPYSSSFHVQLPSGQRTSRLTKIHSR